jgi:hypothetical protein
MLAGVQRESLSSARGLAVGSFSISHERIYQHEQPLFADTRFFKTTSNSTNAASGCARTTSRITVACTSRGETLPPRGFASALPLSSTAAGT